MTDEHDVERFLVVRAVHLETWSEGLDLISPSFVKEWTGFERIKVDRISLGLVDSNHLIRIEDDEKNITFRLTKKGRDWPTRR